MSIQTVIPGAFRKIEETDLFIFLIFHERLDYDKRKYESPLATLKELVKARKMKGVSTLKSRFDRSDDLS